MFSGFGLLIRIAHMIDSALLIPLLMMEYGRGPTWKTNFISRNMVTKI